MGTRRVELVLVSFHEIIDGRNAVGYEMRQMNRRYIISEVLLFREAQCSVLSYSFVNSVVIPAICK